MHQWTSFPQRERQLRSNNYKPFYNSLHEEAITSELCPACNLNLKYIGYKSPYRYRAFMYCGTCSYWEEYL
jgi:hypothetical protein